MNKIMAVICVIALTLLPCVSYNATAADAEALFLYEVIPAGSFEAVTVYNAGSFPINMKDYYLDDGEGTLRFTNDIYIEAKEKMTFASAAPDEWFTGHNVILYGTNGLIAKSFILADNGDEVSLKRVSDGRTMDAFVYGNGDTTIEGWNGPAFGRIAAGKIAVRVSAFDTDTANDWRISVAGRTNEKISSSGHYDSIVTPFIFPDSKGGPVFRALEDASSEVLISMYLLDHRDIISLLMLLLDNGVEVKILIEGSPAGGVPDIEIRYLTQLYEKGAEINIMKSNGGYKRYDLLHNKYAVIDSRTVVTTSENWREVSFTGNRGWGSVIESEDYAEYMRNIFFEDDDISKYDIFSLKQLYPSAAPISVPQYRSKITEEYETFSASVKPVLSPDFSFDYLEREMTNASERIYAEQMSVQYAWTDISLRSPLSWSLTAAGNGADVRIIADVTFDNEDDAYKDNYTVVSLINDMEGMQARTISGGDDFGLTHNKGVIIDDTVWVSSINWSNAAFLNNREVATEICSREVADYFVYYFMLDWGNDTEMDITVRITGNTSGKPVIMDASFGSFPKGTIFEWDLDGDGKIDRTGVKIAAVFPEGVHDCVLFATDVNGSRYVYEFTVTIENNDGSSFLGPYVKYAPIVAIMLIMLFVALFRRKRGSKG